MLHSILTNHGDPDGRMCFEEMFAVVYTCLSVDSWCKIKCVDVIPTKQSQTGRDLRGLALSPMNTGVMANTWVPKTGVNWRIKDVMLISRFVQVTLHSDQVKLTIEWNTSLHSNTDLQPNGWVSEFCVQPWLICLLLFTRLTGVPEKDFYLKKMDFLTLCNIPVQMLIRSYQMTYHFWMGLGKYRF